MVLIYLDHAATSWPKPPQVVEAMKLFVESYGANPGRGAHQMAVKAGRVIVEARMNLAKLLNVKNANDIAFTANTTSALNLAIKGCLRHGDHVVCTMVEHNSVRRPLEFLKRTLNIQVTYVEADETGAMKVEAIKEALRSDTRLLICNHSSNLLGTILPVAEIAELLHGTETLFLVDGAQTVGVMPVDIEALGIHMLAFPGHKGLLGPQGTGGLYISPELDLVPLLHGGTGSQSESKEQPNVRPDRYEAGTPNTPGIAGWNEGVKAVLHETPQSIHNKEYELVQRMMEGLSAVKGISLLGPKLGAPRTGIVAFTLEGIESARAAHLLDRQYDIAVRSGYHCTPLAHQSAGTMEFGAVRASVGLYTTAHEVDDFVRAVQEIQLSSV